MVKESTATTFVFNRGPGGGWRTALVLHPRLGDWMPPGGHVEDDENAAEAALREVAEETGLAVELVPAAMAPLPARFPHATVAQPWWITEMRARADSHTPSSHIHVDHVFLAVARTTTPTQPPAHEVRWLTEEEAGAEPGIAEDSRLCLKELFSLVAGASATI
jgi:8-oxo-dGTP pyrophosphatase MutT (NUDIX family)